MKSDKKIVEEAKNLPCDLRLAETPAHKRLLRSILNAISDKSGFLIEERLKDILKPYMDYEKTLIRVDSVFSVSIKSN